MENILFIDDDPKCLSSLKRMLHKHVSRWSFYFAESVDDGLEYIKRQAVDLVFCDILMPEKSGFDLLSVLKNNPETDTIPVVMLTGSIEPNLKIKALNLGATDLLNKPIEKPELLSRITSCLRIKSYQNQIIDQNLFLEAKIQERTRHAQMAAKIGSILVKETHLGHMAGQCCRTIVHYLDAAFSRIWLFNEEEACLELIASEGMYTHINGEHSRIRLGKLKIGTIAQNKIPHLTNSVIGDPNINNQEWAKTEKMVAFAGHPLVVEKRVVGVIALFSKHRLDDSTLDVLASIADEIALGLDRKRTADKAWFYAYHDVLTQLPNRALFLESLTSVIEYAWRYENKFAVILLDFDNFNRINESLGHEAGDDCLKQASERLKWSLRNNDSLARLTTKEDPVARMGGDEFIIILQNIEDIYEIGKACQRLLNAFSNPIHIGTRKIFISASIGAAVFPEDGENTGALLKNAETALYHAKKKGKNTFSFYSKSMNQKSIQLLEMETDLRRAIADQQFKLYFQPKFDLSQEKITGAEALIRWETKSGEFIPPSEFIPLSEKNGLIIPIGEWVLETACRTGRNLQRNGIKNIRIAINVSALQLGQDDLTDKVEETLEKYCLEPRYLELEITETLVMSDPEKAIYQLNRIRQLGVSIALDDFGTGYSSLAYLQKFPIDYVKIDISFIKCMLASPNDEVMVKTIIAMAHNLGVKVIAEGVEKKEQMIRLDELGCDVIQGYFIGRPMPESEFICLVN